MADQVAVGWVDADTFALFDTDDRVLLAMLQFSTTLDRGSRELAAVLGNTTPDADAPTFAGANSLVALNARTIRATWLAGNDVVTDAGDLRYEVHLSKSASAAFTVRAIEVGNLTTDFADLLPETTYYVRVRCRDEAGNVDGNNVERSVTTPADVAGRPTVSVVSPSAGATIVSTQSITFNATDDGTFRKVLAFAKFANGVHELVHNGSSFSPYYANSSRSVISGGFQYVVNRSGGWPTGAIAFEVVAIDTQGNENE